MPSSFIATPFRFCTDRNYDSVTHIPEGRPNMMGRMLERATTRVLPVLNRAADVAPAAQACCGVCRACATTNIVGIAFAAATGAALWLGRAGRRLARRY